VVSTSPATTSFGSHDFSYELSTRSPAIAANFGCTGSAKRHSFGRAGWCGVWEAHHAERVEQSDQAGGDRYEKCDLERDVARVGVDADDLILGLLRLSGELLLELVAKGVSREDAYRWVQRNAMRVWDEGGNFKEKVLSDADIIQRCSPREIETVFDSTRLVRNVDSIFERVFGNARAEKI